MTSQSSVLVGGFINPRDSKRWGRVGKPRVQPVSYREGP
jgi:hypothetical protein